jgi:hypothetical protein
MNAKEEKAWLLGERAAWTGLLHQAMNYLGYIGPDFDKARWIAEREAAIAQLRSLCADFGDNEWEPDLNLADIIDKHLGRHLHSEGK